jgi:pimeloyl-ACP methyl ester carboxylesterase
VDEPYLVEHGENLVQSGYAVLRYDGPGWGGRSSKQKGFETLEYRKEEAIAAVKYLHSRPDIRPKAVGLWGFSQGGWICQMAASACEDVAFIIPISGPGVTPGEQEVYRVEAETKAAGFGEDAVAKAVLMRRLMLDTVLAEPKYEALDRSEAQRLGGEPWTGAAELIYSEEPISPGDQLEKVIEVIQAVKGEPWTEFLYLDQILAMFESLSPEAWEGAKAQMRVVMVLDPADFLTKVHCPVLAIFGSDDTSLPVERSVTLYKQYLDQAGNEAVTIEVFPKAGHTIHIGDEYAPGYFDLLRTWLGNLPA